MGPGTAKTSLPWSAARWAVIKEPLPSAASTTSVPSASPLMTRLRCGKFCRRGPARGGNSETSAPAARMRSARPAFSGGYMQAIPVPSTATVRPPTPSAPSWLAASIPVARPLVMVSPALAKAAANSLAIASPEGRGPTRPDHRQLRCVQCLDLSHHIERRRRAPDCRERARIVLLAPQQQATRRSRAAIRGRSASAALSGLLQKLSRRGRQLHPRDDLRLADSLQVSAACAIRTRTWSPVSPGLRANFAPTIAMLMRREHRADVRSRSPENGRRSCRNTAPFIRRPPGSQPTSSHRSSTVEISSASSPWRALRRRCSSAVCGDIGCGIGEAGLDGRCCSAVSSSSRLSNLRLLGAQRRQAIARLGFEAALLLAGRCGGGLRALACGPSEPRASHAA